jgi:hypothetical protein
MEFFMTLIKKSDVHRHTSTGSREDRQVNRPYGAPSTPVKNEPTVPPAEVKPETPTAAPEE